MLMRSVLNCHRPLLLIFAVVCANTPLEINTNKIKKPLQIFKIFSLIINKKHECLQFLYKPFSSPK